MAGSFFWKRPAWNTDGTLLSLSCHHTPRPSCSLQKCIQCFALFQETFVFSLNLVNFFMPLYLCLTTVLFHPPTHTSPDNHKLLTPIAWQLKIFNFPPEGFSLFTQCKNRKQESKKVHPIQHGNLRSTRTGKHPEKVWANLRGVTDVTGPYL